MGIALEPVDIIGIAVLPEDLCQLGGSEESPLEHMDFLVVDDPVIGTKVNVYQEVIIAAIAPAEDPVMTRFEGSMPRASLFAIR